MRFRLWQMTLQSKPLPITANLQDIVMETFTSSSRPMISAQLAYTLGACFDVSLLEERCRSFVVQFFEGFMRSSEYFNLLSIWCPGKLYALVRDGTTAHFSQQQQVWEAENQLMDELIVRHCKPVSPWFFQAECVRRSSNTTTSRT